MINANELRIGNIVIGSHSDTPSIVGYHEVTAFDLYGNRNNFFEPIPLMPEILEKFGFEKLHPYKIWSNGKCGLSYKEDGTWHETIGNSFKYVHQLQNLYFALTGEELNINL